MDASRKEGAVLTQGRTFRAVLTVVLCAAAAAVVWGMASGVAQEEAAVGRYQMAVPDLVLDTATGRLVDGNGRVLEQPVDPTGAEAGRYCVDGYVTAVPRQVGLDVIQQPTMRVELVKGYILGDTKTGTVVRQRIYYSQPIRANDL
jgi:hypothetical protein